MIHELWVRLVGCEGLSRGAGCVWLDYGIDVVVW